MRLFGWALQILILTAGIHLFLRFVRTTRGNRLIRGLFVSVLVGVVGLWGLSTALDLEELKHLLRGSTGLVVVGLAIVFQSELRRAIAQIGERFFGGGITRTASADTVRKVVHAARAMALRREGALIAFERDSSLQTYMETGTLVQANVNTRLLESIFHPGGALHDGAVIIRHDHVASAGSFLPLPEDVDLDPALGTRHRAALGLTEESDAVVLVVSEESGGFSLASGGKIRVDVDPERLEQELRALIESKDAGERRSRARLVPALLGGLRRDYAWLAGSLLLACGVFYVAHKSIQQTRELPVRILDAGGIRRPPQEGEILVILPLEDKRLKRPAPDEILKVAVTGSRSQFDDMGGGLRGTVEIDDPAWEGGPLLLDDVRWEDPVLGLGYRWIDDPPELEIEKYETRRIQLTGGDINVDQSQLDPRFQASLEGLAFEPGPTIQVKGPTQRLDALGDSIRLNLQTVALSSGDRGKVRERLRLGSALVDQGLRLVDEPPVEVVIPILPVKREVGTITKEIALICLSPDRAEELDRWHIPANAQTARFTIETTGLIPVHADPGSPAFRERFTAIHRFVDENLRVFVDVAELPPRGEGRSVPIRWTWRKDWRQSLESLGLDNGSAGTREQLDVRLESERQILLELLPSASPSGQESL